MTEKKLKNVYSHLKDKDLKTIPPIFLETGLPVSSQAARAEERDAVCVKAHR